MNQLEETQPLHEAYIILNRAWSAALPGKPSEFLAHAQAHIRRQIDAIVNPVFEEPR